jgi:uncharacterized protein (DUF885 family)
MMAGMPESTPRAIADAYLDDVATLDPIVATMLGLPKGADRLPDLSPAGSAARADLARTCLADLDAATPGGPEGTDGLPVEERRCARLLRERLKAALALHDAGEDLRTIGVIGSPVQSVRLVFQLMPTSGEEDWSMIAARLRAVPEAYGSYRASLEEGMSRGLLAGPRQVGAVLEQLATWTGDAGGDGGRGWFAEFAAAGPEGLRTELDEAAGGADRAVTELRAWLADVYAPAAAGGPDGVGRERYLRFAGYWTGSRLDLEEVYAWGWQEFARLDAQLREEAAKVLPGATPRQAMHHLDEHGEAIDGVEEVRAWLQGLMEQTIAEMDGVHVDLAEPVRRVEAMIAPAGSAAAPYYSRPSLDFSRPGRTWLPTLGRTRFPVWELVSTWYHEGVPGHHLQLAQWVYVADRLSRYQSSLGSVSAATEGWALYAERLMDELGFLSDPGRRMGYLAAQQMRAVRVIVDIGMHLELEIPADQGVAEPFRPGQRWTPEFAREFLEEHTGRPAEFVDSEIVRYLGMPGQAISYKLGERAWLAGREAARRAHAERGEAFDLKAWHMAALSLGSLGLDDLVDELAAL